VTYKEPDFAQVNVPWSKSLLILEQHSIQPIQFKGQVYSLCKLWLTNRVRCLVLFSVIISPI